MAAMDPVEQLASVDTVIKEFDNEYDTSSEKWTALERVASAISAKYMLSDKPDDFFLIRLSTAMFNVLDEDKKLTFQHIETWFRRRKFEIWIVGTDNPRPDTTILKRLDDSEARFALHVIVNTPLLAIVDIIFGVGVSYVDNFARLSDTGVMIVK